MTKVVILAGGFGTRLSEETTVIPKPLIEVGPHPILYHIMNIYSSHGFNEFIICAGYKAYLVKEYFSNLILHHSDISVQLQTKEITYHDANPPPWSITVADTGLESMTGGRLKRIAKYLTPGESFMLTYGDGVGDIDIKGLLAFHQRHGLAATLTAVRPPGRFGALKLEDDRVSSFHEKLAGDGGYINGGFFVLEPEVLDYIEGDHTIWEREPMERLATEGKLAAFRHNGFWHPLDTRRDKDYLNSLWSGGKAPWKSWD